MVVKSFYKGNIEDVHISECCYDRLEAYFGEFKEYLKEATEDDIEEACTKTGIVRSRITGYITCLYDLGQLDYYAKAVLTKHYSDKITISYDDWQDTI